MLGVMVHDGMKYVKKDYTGPSDDSPYSASTTVVWRFWVKKVVVEDMRNSRESVHTLNEGTTTWLAYV